jgi:hypothetical protein
MQLVDRSASGRVHRKPDLFLSHSTRDKQFVQRLADDLAICGVDVWLDAWEIQPGESIHDVISQALSASRFIGIVLGDNFNDSRWASDEMKQALARERRENRVVVIPLIAGSIQIPAFIEDKLYVDLRSNYFSGIARVSAMINEVPQQHIEDAIRATQPKSMRDSINTLRDAGFEPYVVMSKEDGDVVLECGGLPYGEDMVRFTPEEVESNPNVSPRLRRIMNRLRTEVW